jgi:nucleoside 2-deoxyribosyltransferase
MLGGETMKIYFAASIRGGRGLQQIYQALVEHMQHAGHQVLTEHVASEMLAEEGLSDAEIYRTDTGYLNECDCVVAEVTIPSLGVGYEIGYALYKAQKPVLCLCQQGTDLSAMIQGNPRLHTVFYGGIEEALREIDLFLS